MSNKIIQARLSKHTITIQSRGRLIYLISKNKQVWIWYQGMKYVNNTKIIRASKLFTEMRNLNAEYNLREIYNDSKESKFNNNAMVKTV